VLNAHPEVQMAPQTGSTEKERKPVSAFLQLFTWEEIRIHNGHGPSKEQWLVIDRNVYDVSNFSKRHPGGSRVIGHYAGQDATVRSRDGVEEYGSSVGTGEHGWTPVENTCSGWHHAQSDKAGLDGALGSMIWWVATNSQLGLELSDLRGSFQPKPFCESMIR